VTIVNNTSGPQWTPGGPPHDNGGGGLTGSATLGSGVKRLAFHASGAQSTIANTTVPSATAKVPLISAEGVSTLTFFATDRRWPARVWP